MFSSLSCAVGSSGTGEMITNGQPYATEGVRKEEERGLQRNRPIERREVANLKEGLMLGGSELLVTAFCETAMSSRLRLLLSFSFAGYPHRKSPENIFSLHQNSEHLAANAGTGRKGNSKADLGTSEADRVVYRSTAPR